MYPFPYMEVCFGGGNGCDRDEPETNCINTVTATVIDACEDPWDVQVPSAPEVSVSATFDLISETKIREGLPCGGLAEMNLKQINTVNALEIISCEDTWDVQAPSAPVIQKCISSYSKDPDTNVYLIKNSLDLPRGHLRQFPRLFNWEKTFARSMSGVISSATPRRVVKTPGNSIP